MILGNIANFEQDKKGLAGALVKGLEYLKNTDFDKLPEGKYQLDGDKFKAIVQEYETAPKSENQAETHRKYIDIQYLHRGTEIIGYGLFNSENEILEDCSADKDAIFYLTVKDEVDLVFRAGMYAVFFPTDVHRPCCSFGERQKVKKVVLKVAVDLLSD